MKTVLFGTALLLSAFAVAIDAPVAPAVAAPKENAPIRIEAQLVPGEKSMMEITITSGRAVPSAKFQAFLSQGNREISRWQEAIGDLREPVVRRIPLAAAPQGESGLIIQVVAGRQKPSAFRALAWVGGRLVAADSFPGLKAMAWKADTKLSKVERARREAELFSARTKTGGVAAGDAAGATISGRVTYRNRDDVGYPAREVSVKLVDPANEPVSYGNALTDVNGNFTITVPAIGEGDYRVMAASENRFGAVQTSSGSHRAYGSPVHLRPGDSVSGMGLDIDRDSQHGRAFALLDAHFSAMTFYRSIRRSGWRDVVSVYYPSTSSFALLGDIHISGGEIRCDFGGREDWCQEDAFDWDVLGHELGHVVAYEANISDSWGGPHSGCTSLWTDDKYDGLTLAWSEGWATFFGEVAFSGNAPQGMPLTRTGMYQDMPGPPHWTGGQLELNLEQQSSCPGGDDSEHDITRALWDMWDPANDDGLDWSFGDMLQRIDDADAPTFSKAYAALKQGRSADELSALGAVLETFGMASGLTAPIGGSTSKDPLEFRWNASGPVRHRNNLYYLRIRNGVTGSVLLEQGVYGTSYRPDSAQWKQIVDVRAVTVEIVAYETGVPITGGYGGFVRSLDLYGVPDVPRIMVVGDSISHGFESDYTWRYRLKSHLNAVGQASNFVGPSIGVNHLGGPDPFYDGRYGPTGTVTFDSDHFARWGWQAGMARNEIGPMVSTFTPHYLLVELGFNDLAWNLPHNPDAVLNDVKAVVTNARTGNPDIQVLVANVVHRTPLAARPNLAAATNSYNSKLAAAIPGMSTARSRVALVDLNSVYSPSTDAYDGLHPNVTGEYKIAKAFADVLATKFQVGRTFGGIPAPGAQFRPSAPRWISATAKQDGIEISWDRSFGAGGYWLWSRDTTLNGAFQRSALPIAADSWSTSWVLRGHTYEYWVVPAKGDFDGGPSGTAAVVANPLTAAGASNVRIYPGSGKVTVNWDKPTGPYSESVTDYRLYWFDEDESGFIMKSSGLTKNLTMDITGLINGHRHIIVVASKNAYGEGMPTAGPAVIPGYGTPAPPTLNEARVAGQLETWVSWSPSAHAAGYYVRNRNYVNNGSWSTYPDMKSGTGSILGWQFPPDQQEYCMIAANGSLLSAPGNCRVAMQDTPYLIRAKLVDLTMVTLEWTESPGASEYQILMRDHGKGDTAFHLVKTARGTNVDVWSLEFADQMEWCIVAVGPSGSITSPRSNARFSQA